MSKTFKTLLITILATGTCLAAPEANSKPQVDAKLATSQGDLPGYSRYLRDTPAKVLDETVDTTPAFGQDAGFLSREGLFRYAYYLKTGLWVSNKEAEQALNDPYDEGNW